MLVKAVVIYFCCFFFSQNEQTNILIFKMIKLGASIPQNQSAFMYFKPSKINHPSFCPEPFQHSIWFLFISLLLLADPPISLPFLLPSFFLFYFLKSHLRLPGMSHCSTVPSGAAPVILKGRVHLSKQWIKNCPKDRGEKEIEADAWMKGHKKKKKTLDKWVSTRSLFFKKEKKRKKVAGQIWPPLVTAASCRASVNPGFTSRPPSRPHSLT